MKEGTYRHELKYIIGYSDYLSLRARLSQVMKRDVHADENGCYRIRSLYFDNYRDKALREKIAGVAVREKFRIRYYNDDLSRLTLEKKCKNGDLCRKLAAPVTKEECRRLSAGDTSWMPAHPQALVKELYIKMKSEQLRPRVLVSYLREPWVYKAGNVRVTFDSEIRSTLFHRCFPEENPTDIDVMDDKGERILEVKYDAYLPEVVAVMLQTGRCRQQAFSKYGACRRFG